MFRLVKALHLCIFIDRRRGFGTFGGIIGGRPLGLKICLFFRNLARIAERQAVLRRFRRKFSGLKALLFVRNLR